MQTLLPLAASVAARLVARQETLAVAESSAGGLLAAALLAQAGASRFFVAGAVVYTATAREALLGLTPDMVAGLRSSSPLYAALLAAAMRTRLGTAWGLAETGAAGPAGNRYGDAAGHSCLALAGPTFASPGTRSLVLETGSGDRVANMRAFAAAALGLLSDALDAT